MMLTTLKLLHHPLALDNKDEDFFLLISIHHTLKSIVEFWFVDTINLNSDLPS
jgi:hypothetical protein